MGEFRLGIGMNATNFSCTLTLTEGTMFSPATLGVLPSLGSLVTTTLSFGTLTFGVATADADNVCLTGWGFSVDTKQFVNGTVVVTPPIAAPTSITLYDFNDAALASYTLPAHHGSGTFSLDTLKSA